jgi:integrator complex subunit 7
MLVDWQVKAAIFAAGCICHLSEDFSRTILEVFRRLICSRTSEPQVIMAAIKAFWKLDSTLAVIHRVHEVFMDIHLSLKHKIYPFTSILSTSVLPVQILHLHDCSPTHIELKLRSWPN